MRPLKIFICYRKEETEGYSGRLYDHLSDHFRRRPKNYFRKQAEIIRDVDSIPPGVDWSKYIEGVVGSCDVMIAVIGPQWLTVTNEETGQRRIQEPDDVLAFELSTALSRNIPVIPCLVQSAKLPRASDLPDRLKELPFRQAVELGDPGWDEKADRLIRTLKRVEIKPGPAFAVSKRKGRRS